MNLRAAAKDQACVHCGTEDGTVVLAHRNIPGFFGMGKKGPDIWGAHLCHTCHEVSETEFRKDAGWWERNILKTQLRLLEAGILRVA